MASEWEVIALGDAGVTVIDCVHKTPKAAEQGLPYVAIPQMKTGVLDLSTARRITRDDFEAWTEKALPQPFDVVLSRRCNPGVSAVVPPGMTFALGQNLVLLRSDGQAVYPPYLTWMVRSHYWWAQIGKFINVGAVFDSLRCRDIPKFQLPLPPLPEQRRIAAVLGALDDKIELNRKMNRTLEAMAQALFKSWFIDFDGHDDLVPSELGPIPRGWEVGTLEAIADLNPQSWTKKKHPDAVDYVDLSNTSHGRILDSTPYDWDDAPSRARRMLKPWDTIFGCVRPRNRSYALVYDEGLTGSTGFAVLRAQTPACATFVYLATIEDTNVERLTRVADGAAYPAVRPNVVHETTCVIPSDATLVDFDRITRPLLERIGYNEKESRTLAALRDTLLPKLISGEIRVPEAEDTLQEAGL